MTDFNAKTITALPAPPTGNKFHGFSGVKAQGVTAPGGFGVVVTAGGVRSFVLNYRMQGRERRYTIGRFPTWPVPKAIKRANELRQQVDRGDDPLAARAPLPKPVKELTVAELFDQWAASPARRDKSNVHQLGAFKNHINPVLGKVPYREVKKGAVADLHDAITLGSGPAAANRALTYLQAVLNWKASREDDYAAPSFRGIAQANKEVARDRVLKDDEIATLWPLLGDDTFGKIARLLLLTGQRRSDVAKLTWDEIDFKARTATVPASRYKTGVAHTFALSEQALAILQSIPRRTDGRVFPRISYDKRKKIVDAKVALPHWTLHDLRRTARTLMQRAGVLPHVAERVLGHAQGKIEGTYDRHDYTAEKRHAADALAATIERIVGPPAANVLALQRKA